MVIFYKKWKKDNKILLTKNKMDLNNRIMNDHPPSPVPPGDKPPEHCPKEELSITDRVKLIYICTHALHSFPSFAQPPPSSLCCSRPASHLTQSRYTPYPPATPFLPHSTHSFYPRVQDVSIISDTFYSPTSSLSKEEPGNYFGSSRLLLLLSCPNLSGRVSPLL